MLTTSIPDLFVWTGSHRSCFWKQRWKTDASNGSFGCNTSDVWLWCDKTCTTRTTATEVMGELSHRQWQLKPDNPEKRRNAQYILTCVNNFHKVGRSTVACLLGRHYRAYFPFNLIFLLFPFMWAESKTSILSAVSAPPTHTQQQRHDRTEVRPDLSDPL